MKDLSLTEFVDAGYLQEVNRQFFHPLGLALRARWNDRDAVWTLHGIFDAREDPEGYTFDEFSQSDVERGTKIIDEQYRRAVTRALELGFVIQPLVMAKPRTYDYPVGGTMGEHLDMGGKDHDCDVAGCNQ